MSGFINSIINRSINGNTDIKPRLPGRFEQSIPNTPAPGSFTNPLTAQTETGNSSQEVEEIESGERPLRPPRFAGADNQHTTPWSQPEQAIAPMKQRAPIGEYTGSLMPPQALQRLPVAGSTPGSLVPNRVEPSPSITQNDTTPAVFVTQTVLPRDSSERAKRTAAMASFAGDLIQPVARPELNNVSDGIDKPEPWGRKEKSVAAPSQTIHISIGRIEVRVSQPAAVPAQKSRQLPNTPVMSLDEYLDKRNQTGQ